MRVLNLVTNPNSTFFKQQVASLNRAGIEETTLTVPGDRNYDDGETAARSALDYVRFCPQVLRHSFGEYDIIHANYGLTAPPAVLQPNLPIVLSLWGSDLMGKYGWLSKACAAYADAVVVMTEEMAAELDCEAHVIPHGVDLEKFAPSPTAEARAELGWAADAYHVLFPYPPARGVKDYPRAERLAEAAADRLDRPLQFHTVTGVPHGQMAVYMNAADTLLVTSKREGSPNAVKEAMACNLPVVTTDVGDVATRLADVTPSYVCQTDEELIEGLLEVAREGDRSDGRAAAHEVSIDRTSNRLHQVYHSVLDDT